MYETTKKPAKTEPKKITIFFITGKITHVKLEDGSVLESIIVVYEILDCGSEFHTGTNTKVIAVESGDEHILRTAGNDTLRDNVEYLPLFELINC